MRTKRVVAAVAVLGLLTAALLSGCTTSVTAVSGPAPDTVTTTGTGTGSAAPDKATLSFSATFQATDRVSALNGASKAATAVIAAVEAAGVEATAVQTTQISVNEQRNSAGTTVIGYQAVESISVTTSRLDKVGAIIAAATAAGATDVSGPDFSLSDTNAARVDAIKNAMADAKARAAAVAEAAGRSLGGVVSVTEASNNPLPFASAAAAAPAGGGAVSPPVAPGQVETQAQLTVVFSLQ